MVREDNLPKPAGVDRLRFAIFAPSPYIDPMTLCTVCLHTVPPELLHCPYCDSTLDAEGVEEVNEEFHWTILRTVSTEIEATLIAGRLRAHGVPAFVLSQVDSTRHFTVGALAVAKVFVPESMQAQAEEILSRPPDPYPEENDGEGANDTNHSRE